MDASIAALYGHYVYYGTCGDDTLYLMWIQSLDVEEGQIVAGWAGEDIESFKGVVAGVVSLSSTFEAITPILSKAADQLRSLWLALRSTGAVYRVPVAQHKADKIDTTSRRLLESVFGKEQP